MTHIERKRKDLAFLVGVRRFPESAASASESLEELGLLAGTAGAAIVGRLLLEVKKPHPRGFFGSGQIENIAQLVGELNCDLVIVDCELSPSQHRNLEDAWDVMVLDRTALILDIFASHAKSKEGKFQVEFAQMQYLLPRLRGRWAHLSRLGAGIGTRGPGETALETDRRRILSKIHRLKTHLKQIRQTRTLHREHRKKENIPIIALVGYTNAGKSTLMRALTGANVKVEDKLFATLDPLCRRFILSDGRPVLLLDTVGFIKKLPHHLIEAFKATLEEVVSSDLLIHVVDASSQNSDEQIDIVRSVLSTIGADHIPEIIALNKIDRLKISGGIAPLAKSGADVVPVSALTGENLEELKTRLTMKIAIGNSMRHVLLSLPLNRGDLVGAIHERGRIISEKFLESSVTIEVELDTILADQLKEFWIGAATH